MESEIAALFLAHSVLKINQMTGFIDRCLDELTDDQVWHRDSVHENSIGNLILHLAGNIRQWIGHGLAGLPDIRERDAEFAALGNISRTELRDLLRAVVTPAIDTVAELPPRSSLRRRWFKVRSAPGLRSYTRWLDTCSSTQGRSSGSPSASLGKILICRSPSLPTVPGSELRSNPL